MDISKLYQVIQGGCSRCGGSGRVDRFSHVLGGECFGCNGTGHAYRRLYDNKAAAALIRTGAAVSGEILDDGRACLTVSADGRKERAVFRTTMPKTIARFRGVPNALLRATILTQIQEAA